jgi:hypothetical protein
MIGLRRTAPDRQGNPMRRSAKAERPASMGKYKNRCVNLFWRWVSAQNPLFTTFLPRLMVTRARQDLLPVNTLTRRAPIRCASVTKIAQ